MTSRWRSRASTSKPRRRPSRPRSGGHARTRRDQFASVRTRVVRSEHADPDSNEAATAQWRITVKDADERQRRPRLLERLDRDRTRQHPWLLRAVGRTIGGDTVRRVPPGDRARRPRAAVRPPCRPHARGVVGGAGRKVPSTAARRRAVDGVPMSPRRPAAHAARARSVSLPAPARATRAATPTSACSPARTPRSRGSTAS